MGVWEINPAPPLYPPPPAPLNFADPEAESRLPPPGAGSAGTGTCPAEPSRAPLSREAPPCPAAPDEGAVPASVSVCVCVSPALPAQPPAVAGNPPERLG